MKRLILFITLLSFFSCARQINDEPKDIFPLFSAWGRAGIFEGKSDQEILDYLKNLKSNHIDAVFLDAPNDTYKHVSPIFAKAEVILHAWRPTMINNSKEMIEKHKDWYAVSREGKSVVDAPPYVGYYHFMCPRNPEVKEYLTQEYLKIAHIPGIASIHFDYIRYCDVYLPDALQPHYGLVQDHEMAPYDYCYCDRCRSAFKEEYGRDPMEEKDPSKDKDWAEFRLKPIVDIVNAISAKVAQETGVASSAAVFPTPEMAKTHVRQDWSKFKIDAVCPMLYNGFYNEPISWIGDGVREGIATMEVRKELLAGVYVPDIKEPNKMNEAISQALDNGAQGVVFFNLPDMTDAHLALIKERYEQYEKDNK
ncbi:hypothetical protein K5X82_04465 [Halosquirtibacter xylanolyticus]|uniref:putative glycoside hydrolase n=1 Tax=Halosquirtibacter xylanolyticus TaxID=3374599 RepID=UPI003749037A|nr:hypothetical protein K5X82_04465 [Prolixibacteraceae bacterium]